MVSILVDPLLLGIKCLFSCYKPRNVELKYLISEMRVAIIANIPSPEWVALSTAHIEVVDEAAESRPCRFLGYKLQHQSP